jgi:Flp pilus assembly protein TadG
VRTRGRQRGAALLEFAVALPFALTIFLGISDFSVYFWSQTQMEEVARFAANRIAPDLPAYAAATDKALEELAHSLQDAVRKDSGRPEVTVALSRQFACPLADGKEKNVTAEPQLCEGERVYLRVVSDRAVAPLLGPLRLLGFPKTAFSRHVVRVR